MVFMKTKKGIIIAVSAGIAVAGLVAFLFATEKGKKITGSWKNKGQKFFGDMEDVISGAREKFAGLKEELLKENKKETVEDITI